MTKFTDNPAVQAMVVRMAKDKLPPGVKRATQQADKSALIASAKPARQAIQGYLGMDPSYSVMDPQAERLASAYRTGEATSVLGDLAGALSPFAYASALSKVGQVPGIAELIAYHGSPHKFKKFDASKIGTGEGAQAFGHGLYFAEAPEVAEGYARNLANRDLANQGRLNAHANAQRLANLAGDPKYAADDVRFVLSNEPNHPQKRLLQDTLMFLESGDFAKPLQTKGSLYKVDIPDEKIAQMLDWDKPLSQQPKAVQEAINKSEYALRDMAMDLYGKKDPLGSEIARAALKPQEFAEHMKELGVPGIRYLDQGSRGTGKGTSNFVVFPGEEESIKMLEINGTPEMAAGGPVRMQDGGDPTARFMGKTKPQGIMQAKGFGEGPGMRPLQEAADVGRGLFGAEAIIPGGEGYRTGQALANMPAVGLAAVPGKVASALPDVATGLGALGAAGVIKPKGGNWLAGAFSAEKALDALRKRGPTEVDREWILQHAERQRELGQDPTRILQGIESIPRNEAINKWIDTKLTKYVKNEMATPEDPVRALAERGTLHFEPQDVPRPMGFEKDSRTLRESREAGGYPIEGLGKSNLAKDWEALADINIQPDKAEVFLPIKSELERNPWLEKVSPDTPVYGMNLSADMSRLGFPHIIDELTNALNPNSGLPASLRLTPQQLEKVTVPQAVERVAKINEWRAAQKAEADALRARNPGTFEHKTYETVPGTAEPNQKGLRWVELKLPEIKELPPGYLVKPMSKEGRFAVYGPDGRSTGAVGRSPEEAIANQQVGRQSLEDALKYEGEVMGHCVGGYCPDVIEGRSRIYSLRDKKGEPHVTIEVQPQSSTPYDVWYGQRAHLGDKDPEVQEFLRWTQETKPKGGGLDAWFEQWAKENGREIPQIPTDIVQIKGKGNKAPKDEYLPFVQDFVRSGNWSRVGDLKNTGLIAIDRGSDLAAAMKAENATIPKYVTQEELTDLLKKYNAYGYKRGGKVRISENPDVQAMVVKMAKELPKAVNKGKKYA